MGITHIQLNRGNYYEDAFQVKVRHKSAYFSCRKYGYEQALLLAQEMQQTLKSELPRQENFSQLRNKCGPFYLTLNGRVLVLKMGYRDSRGVFRSIGRSLGKRTLKDVFNELWRILREETGRVPLGKKVIARYLVQGVNERIELERNRGVPVPDVKFGYGSDYCDKLTANGVYSLVKKRKSREDK